MRSAATGRGRPTRRRRRVVDPEAARARRSTSASAAATPVRPAMTVVGTCSGQRDQQPGAVLRDSRCGRWTTSAPSSAAAGVPAECGGRGEQVLLVGPLAAPGGRGRPGGGARPRGLGRWTPPARRGRRGTGRAAPGRCSPGPTRWPGARRRARTARGRRPARPAWRPPAPAWTPASCPGRPAWRRPSSSARR